MATGQSCAPPTGATGLGKRRICSMWLFSDRMCIFRAYSSKMSHKPRGTLSPRTSAEVSVRGRGGSPRSLPHRRDAGTPAMCAHKDPTRLVRVQHNTHRRKREPFCLSNCECYADGTLRTLDSPLAHLTHVTTHIGARARQRSKTETNRKEPRFIAQLSDWIHKCRYAVHLADRRRRLCRS